MAEDYTDELENGSPILKADFEMNQQLKERVEKVISSIPDLSNISAPILKSSSKLHVDIDPKVLDNLLKEMIENPASAETKQKEKVFLEKALKSPTKPKTQ